MVSRVSVDLDPVLLWWQFGRYPFILLYIKLPLFVLTGPELLFWLQVTVWVDLTPPLMSASFFLIAIAVLLFHFNLLYGSFAAASTTAVATCASPGAMALI